MEPAFVSSSEECSPDALRHLGLVMVDGLQEMSHLFFLGLKHYIHMENTLIPLAKEVLLCAQKLDEKKTKQHGPWVTLTQTLTLLYRGPASNSHSTRPPPKNDKDGKRKI
ncbi:unnamed protein product [Lepeophtheirus salmonis]|uniref:(salmon louse) hypothetical protein n=1 Tax=Lepeophtheirus salmonis TaxID=72036 RepID=A0A7R8HCS0_LEPSM|nr:unnamed protein product [Lepeophtheirus salmonis]CAF2996986.1 unnamed protein product [Lepeophtheirus salmonis]